ncbi:cupin domain-containing protein [Bacillus marasmi]|uniref:cupin domain-containing protein n=1 Tax=Bacillus marasmi TaxID=1926279 RepID=UPI0011C7AD67|nr:cupin domain-containing protein [Bacillus marasmi]
MNANSTNSVLDENDCIDSSLQLHLTETIIEAIKRKASAIDFYSRLANIAPNQSHKNEVLLILEDEKAHCHQLNDQYLTLTGKQPAYELDTTIPFQTYQEGLEKGYQEKLRAYQGDRNATQLAQTSSVSEVFHQICLDELDHAKQLELLHYSIDERQQPLTDFGPNPFVVNIDDVTEANNTFRTALWTGRHLQVTLMSIGVGEDIGVEMHPNLDQFLRLEQGQGLVKMGSRQNQLTFQREVSDDFAIIVPAGTWHNLTNTGNIPLKLYSIYAPPQHPRGTVHKTKAEAMAAEANH